MKTHYERLEISQDATPEEIKRAYYAAVKKHSPEHSPKEFGRIKSAYEELRDPQKRLLHDSELELDMFELLNYKEAGALLESGKTGKAIKKYEALLKEKPQNLVLLRGLADAYVARGFCNKAIAQYEKCLAVNELDMDTWNTYISCLLENSYIDAAEYAMRRAVDINDIHELGNVDILIYSIIFFIIKKKHIGLDDGFTRKCFDMLHKLDISKSNVENPAMLIVDAVCRLSAAEFIDDALLVGKNIKPQDHGYEKIEELLTAKELVALRDSGDFDYAFIELFDHILNVVETPRERVMLLGIEGYILFENPQLMRKQIRKINDTFPRLFALHKKFFISFLNEKNEERMCAANISQGRAMLKKYPELMDMYSGSNDFILEDDEDEDDDEGEVINIEPVRTEPKIGRNEPCPCGSGKKYKKCCGK